MSCHKPMCKERERHGQSEYLWLPRLSSWASSSSRSVSQGDWETAVPAGDTCRPSHTYKNNRCAFSVCSVWQFGPARVNNRQNRRISLRCFPVCPSPPFFSSPRSPFAVLASCSLTWCFPPVASKNLNDLPGVDSLCYLYPSLPACLPSYGGYFYSFVLRKQEQIKFWAHQHFQGPTAAEWEGKHWNPIAQLDTLLITGYDWYRL